MRRPLARSLVTTAGRWALNPLWRTARAVPSLDLRFAESKSLADAVSGRSLVTFTRASSATVIGSTGVLETVSTDQPRFHHDPITGESLGLLVEEQRTNLLLNSGTLSTQSVTVTAAVHTLSFSGTGTVTLSGTSTAGPLVGTGIGESNRVSLTFTPTAGTLTLTVSGTVSNAQLEQGAFATSVIPTTTAAATRNADVVSITGTNFSSWYRQNEGSFFCSTFAPKGLVIFGTGDTFDNTQYAVVGPSGNVSIRSGGAVSAILNSPVSTTTNTSLAFAYAVNNFGAVSNGGAVSADSLGPVPVGQIRLKIGSSSWDTTGSNNINGTIRRLTYWPARLPDATLQALTR